MPHGMILSLGMLVLGVAVCLVYYPAARGPFIFDDFSTIVDNPSIRQLWPLVGSGESAGPLNPPEKSAVYRRPLVNLSLAVNYYFGGLDPFGYRVAHIVVHFLSALLLWAIVDGTLRLDYFQGRFDGVAGPLSFGAAILWAMHPLNTESIVYVTQRTELLMGMFYLATLYGGIRYWTATRRAVRATFLVLATLACLSGMLCKEMMASAPVMVLLFDRTFVAGSLRRALSRSWPLYIGLALGWAPLLALRLYGPPTAAAGFYLGVAAHEWWFTQAKVLWLYFELTVWPWPLVIHYEIPILKTVADAWPWLLATGLLAMAAFVLHWRRRAEGFVAVWVFAVLSPTLIIPLVGETVAERRMYVPLAAIAPLFVAGGYVLLQRAWRFAARRAGRESIRGRPIKVFAVATIALAIGFGAISSRRLLAYRDRLSLWQDACLHQPHDPVVQLNLGTLLAEAGRLPEAIPHFEEAVRLTPDYQIFTLSYAEPLRYRASFNLARAFELSARPQDAIEQYRVTLKLPPDHAQAHFKSHHNLACLLEDAGHEAQAIEHYRKAIAAKPDFATAHSNIGILLMNVGERAQAIKHFETALRLQENLENYAILAEAYSWANRPAKAIPMAEKALELARSKGDASRAKELEATLKQLRLQRFAP